MIIPLRVEQLLHFSGFSQNASAFLRGFFEKRPKKV